MSTPTATAIPPPALMASAVSSAAASSMSATTTDAPARGEALGVGAPDAPARPGDDGDLAGEVVGRHLAGSSGAFSWAARHRAMTRSADPLMSVARGHPT